APTTSKIALVTVSVATARWPEDINAFTSLAAPALSPIRVTTARLKSCPAAALTTARNGNPQSTASAENANELFMKSTAESWDQYRPGAVASPRVTAVSPAARARPSLDDAVARSFGVGDSEGGQSSASLTSAIQSPVRAPNAMSPNIAPAASRVIAHF